MDAREGHEAPESPKLVFRSGLLRGRVETLSGNRVTIGRNRENDIVLDLGHTISSFHAVVVRSPEDGSWWIEDLRSKNGTLVNGKRIDRARLAEGDMISFAGREVEISFTTREPEPDGAGFLDPTQTARATDATPSAPATTPGAPGLGTFARRRRAAALGAVSAAAAATALGAFLWLSRPPSGSSLSEPALRLSARIDPIYGSLFLSYRDQPIGAASVTNMGKDRLSDLTLTFTFGDEERFLVVPFVAPIEELPAGAAREIALLPRLSNDVLSPQTREVRGLVRVVRGKDVLAEEAVPIFIHGRNVFNWEQPDRIAAFVDPQDPALVAFVQAVWQRKPAAPRHDVPPESFRSAVAIVTGLAALGLTYLPDAKTPISSKIDWKANDRVNYPWETLTSRAGDCDDLSVLCAAALEAVNIPAALVVCPQHVFVLFDAGLEAASLPSLPLDPATVISRNGRVWVPLETTVFGRPGAGFGTAWAEGWSRRELVESGESSVVEVRSGWEKYSPMNPSPDERTQESIARNVWADAGTTAAVAGAIAEIERLLFQNVEEKVRAIEGEIDAGPERDRAIGVLYTQSGLFDRARASFQKALFGEKQLEAARADLGRAVREVERRPDTPYLLLALGICLTLGADSAEALGAASACYERGLDLLSPEDSGPERGEFALRLALVSRLRGDLASEKKWSEEAFRMAPFLRETYRSMLAGEGARAAREALGANGGGASRRFLLKGLK